MSIQLPSVFVSSFLSLSSPIKSLNSSFSFLKNDILRDWNQLLFVDNDTRQVDGRLKLSHLDENVFLSSPARSVRLRCQPQNVLFIFHSDRRFSNLHRCRIFAKRRTRNRAQEHKSGMRALVIKSASARRLCSSAANWFTMEFLAFVDVRMTTAGERSFT